MKILVINAGSSSLKFQLIDMDDESVRRRAWLSASASKARTSSRPCWAQTR